MMHPFFVHCMKHVAGAVASGVADTLSDHLSRVDAQNVEGVESFDQAEIKRQKRAFIADAVEDVLKKTAHSAIDKGIKK